MTYFIQKITSCVVDDKGKEIEGTEFVHYEIVDKRNGQVRGMSKNILKVTAILKKLQAEDGLKIIAP